MTPAVLSMKAGTQLSLTEAAVKPANVIPAENGCYGQDNEPQLIVGYHATYSRDTKFVFVSDMYIFNSYL